MVLFNHLRHTVTVMPGIDLYYNCEMLLRVPRLCYSMARRGNSEWVYSGKMDQMEHARPGRVYVCSDVGSDVHDCTLRMHQRLTESHLVLSYRPAHTLRMLRAMVRKEQWVGEEDGPGQQVVAREGGGLVQFTGREVKQQGLELALQTSKQAEMLVETQRIDRSNNDPQNRQLKQKQEELVQYMEVATAREGLEKYRGEHGHPRVAQLTDNLHQIARISEGKGDVVCVIGERQKGPSQLLFSFLEDNSIPYEVLPAPNELINMLAVSGMPADRFAVEYFPADFDSMLLRRKPMKMTIALFIKTGRLGSLLEAVARLYGKQHVVYVQGEGGREMRGEVEEVRGEIDVREFEEEGELVRVAVAPYLSAFNEELKEERDKVTQLYGEAMDRRTHFVRMEFIARDIQKLKKRKDRREVSVNTMAEELLGAMGSEAAVREVLKGVLKVKERQAESIVATAQRGIVPDHIGMLSGASKR